MADAYLEIEEYLWLDETIQGNVNVAGLVFDDLVEDSCDLTHEVYTVWVDQVEDTLGFAEGDFTGIHWPAVGDSISFSELFGTPMRVKQSVLNLVMSSPLVPVQIAHIHLDVLHGVDTYWEEVSDELQTHSSYVNAVPYWWEWIYESIDIDMTEPQPLPPITVLLDLLVNDLVNMRHDVTQEYLFNSKCFEEFFAWDGYVWGWDHKVAESLVDTDTIQEIIGKVADDTLYMGDVQVPIVKVKHLIDDRVFIYDTSEAERYYLLVASDTIAIVDSGVSFVGFAGAVNETFDLSGLPSPHTVFMGLATESLIFADLAAFVHDLIIQEGLALGDLDLARFMFNALVASGCNVADIIG